MVVYIVFFINFHGDSEFSGVFSTRELANGYINRFTDERFEIEEVTVDES